MLRKNVNITIDEKIKLIDYSDLNSLPDLSSLDDIDQELLSTSTPTFAGLILTGAVSNGYRAITALRTLDNTDCTIDCTANSFTVTLPTAVGIQGRIYNIKNTGTGTITIATTSSQTIDGEATQELNQWDSITVISTNTNWIIT